MNSDNTMFKKHVWITKNCDHNIKIIISAAFEKHIKEKKEACQTQNWFNERLAILLLGFV